MTSRDDMHCMCHSGRRRHMQMCCRASSLVRRQARALERLLHMPAQQKAPSRWKASSLLPSAQVRVGANPEGLPSMHVQKGV